MAENDPTPEPAPEPTPDPEPEPTPEPDPAQEPDWKAEARKWETRAKENKDAASKLKELEDAQKTEEQKLKDRIAELEPTALEAARLRVALRKGLTETQAKRLVGTSEEEFDTDADELLKDLAPDEEPSVPGKPKPKLRGGGNPTEDPEETDPRKLADEVPRY